MQRPAKPRRSGSPSPSPGSSVPSWRSPTLTILFKIAAHTPGPALLPCFPCCPANKSHGLLISYGDASAKPRLLRARSTRARGRRAQLFVERTAPPAPVWSACHSVCPPACLFEAALLAGASVQGAAAPRSSGSPFLPKRVAAWGPPVPHLFLALTASLALPFYLLANLWGLAQHHVEVAYRWGAAGCKYLLASQRAARQERRRKGLGWRRGKGSPKAQAPTDCSAPGSRLGDFCVRRRGCSPGAPEPQLLCVYTSSAHGRGSAGRGLCARVYGLAQGKLRCVEEGRPGSSRG